LGVERGAWSDVILSEAKDLLSANEQQILRFAQDDNYAQR